jgi:sugar-specific transcriptional regulator TrmB
MLRSRPGLWIHRHLQAWSYAGDLIEVWNDILVRRAGILLNDGERLLELRRDVARESSREDLASGKVEALQQFQARLNSLLERQVEVAEGIARQLDANSRRDQIHELHEFAARAQLGPRTTQANSATL